jgi:aminoglycoside phosphotransferase (APT) family kinase protein
METQLPGTIGLKVAAALRRYREWRGVDPNETAPRLVRALGDQSNNRSFLVANSQPFVVRVNRHDRFINALDPLAELSALQRAGDAGLAPMLRYFDTQAGITVCDYVEPDHEIHPDPSATGRLLRAIHGLDPIPYSLDLVARLQFYAGQIKQLSLAGAAQTDLLRNLDLAVLSAQRLQAADHDPVLCHNDLLFANRLYGRGRQWAIDWEYAAMGSRWFDLAVIVRGENLEPSSTNRLLSAYLGRLPDTDENERLHWAGECYVHLARAWQLVNAAQPGERPRQQSPQTT